MTAPEGPEALVRRGTVITAIALLGVAGVYVLAWGYTPIEARQGLGPLRRRHSSTTAVNTRAQRITKTRS